MSTKFTISEPGQRTASGDISFADVLHAVTSSDGTIDASVGAITVRRRIGRGGPETIQRHLKVIREELAARDRPAGDLQIPPPPPDVITAVWAAAWQSVSAQTLARHDKLVRERDEWIARGRDAASDLAEAHAEVDALRASLEAARSDAEAAAAAAADEAAEAIRAADAAAAEIARLRVELKDAKHAAELSVSHFEIERKTLQSQIERQERQIAELMAAQIHAARLQAELDAARKPAKD